MMDEILLHYLKQAAENDKDAFSEFAKSISKRVLSIAYGITGDRMYAEDVLNIVLLRVWENAEKIIKLKKPVGYINTIAYNAALDFKRQAQELPLSDTLTEADYDLAQKIDIDTALERLSADEREIVLYHVHARFSFRKIALATGCTKKAVYLKYKKAVEKLKEFLS